MNLDELVYQYESIRQKALMNACGALAPTNVDNSIKPFTPLLAAGFGFRLKFESKTVLDSNSVAETIPQTEPVQVLFE